jgi:hypothetical protein
MVQVLTLVTRLAAAAGEPRPPTLRLPPTVTRAVEKVFWSFLSLALFAGI